MFRIANHSRKHPAGSKRRGGSWLNCTAGLSYLRVLALHPIVIEIRATNSST